MNPLLTICILCSAFHEVYPLSMVPGGISSDADLERVRQSYVPEAAVYSDVGFVNKTYMHADQKLWASYFRDNEVFWAQVTVRKGEEVFVDRYGNMIRARCGNRLCPILPRHAKTFVAPNSEIPEIVYFPPPEIPVGILPYGPVPPPVYAPPVYAPPVYTPPVYTPVVAGTGLPPLIIPPIFIATPPPTIIIPPAIGPPGPGAVPEPGTWTLFVTGGLLVFLFNMGRKRLAKTKRAEPRLIQ